MDEFKHTSARKKKIYDKKISDHLGKDTLKGINKEEKRKQKKEKRKYEIKQSTSYRSLETIKKWMDVYFLDPILGLVPVYGDAFTKIFSIPFVYVSLFKIKSIPLTLAVIFNILLDFLIGLIPFFIGNISDFFFKSYKKNFELIIGFVEDDREIITKVNRKAIWMAFYIVLVILLIYAVISLVISILKSSYDLISGLFSYISETLMGLF